MYYDIVKITNFAEGQQREEMNRIFAPDKKTLMSMFATGGDHIKIIREYEDDISYSKGNKEEHDPINNVQTNTNDSKTEQTNEEETIKTVDMAADKTTQSVSIISVDNNIVNEQKPSETRYFKVGNVECKMQDNKLYQKQWVKVKDEDSYRIISDKTNKIFPIKEKHIEKLSWVLIEDNGETA